MTFTPIRRVVTGHDDNGRAVVIADDELEPTSNPSGSSRLAVVWTTATAPVDNDDASDGRERATGLTLPGGSVLRVVDLLPGRSAPLHRTSSIDYGVVLSGPIELLLDDGAATWLETGDIVIQRGTIHGWRNPSTETTARVVFTLLDATPATFDGEALPDIHPGSVRTE